ncbi:2,3-diaminopropionate biosynthesis protein SbnA [Dactylosporangium sp. NPDC000555]|uniref:2,3-diaminopropionate biosynthesis protein SbnA n=1 Tax=Dactylosporangium sp. NPDC000555 TaxID=3154260 RepID=UPI00331AA4EA
MAVITRADELHDSDLYVDLRAELGLNLRLRCDGLNLAGSVKLRPAVAMVAQGLASGAITSDSVLVESSSGNLGVALGLVAAANGLRFHCVTDPKCNPTALKLMRAFGSVVEVVAEPDATGSYLTARKARIRELCAADPRYTWLNQYENPANWIAHQESTAPMIAKEFPDLDVLFVGVGTGGTLAGCSRYFRENRSGVRIVAVDSVGSINFGRPAAPRHIPGLGASEPMPLVTADLIDDLVRVEEPASLRMCRRLAGRGFLFGGSTGTVVAGAERWLREYDPAQRLTAVAVSADMGERYVDTIYDDAWITGLYGALEDDRDR